jgi:hypothetical protein
VGGREGPNVAANEDDLPPTLTHDRHSRWGCNKSSPGLGCRQYSEYRKHVS